jgi:hypothetical protein
VPTFVPLWRKNGALGRIRTSDPKIRRLKLRVRGSDCLGLRGSTPLRADSRQPLARCHVEWTPVRLAACGLVPLITLNGRFWRQLMAHSGRRSDFCFGCAIPRLFRARSLSRLRSTIHQLYPQRRKACRAEVVCPIGCS